MPTIALVDDDRNILDLRVDRARNRKAIACTPIPTAPRRSTVSQRHPISPSSTSRCRAWTAWSCCGACASASDLPVIFLTSKDDEIDELFGLKMGADDFVKKPFSQRLLVERVKAVLPAASSQATANGTGKPAEAQRNLDRGALSWTRSATPAPGTAQPVTLTVDRSS